MPGVINRQVKRSAAFLLLGILLASCAASLPYSNDYPLTGELFQSRDVEFSGKIPEGWMVAPLDSVPAMYKSWLLKDGYKATMQIIELHLDALSRREVSSRGLQLLADISISFHNDAASPVVLSSKPKEFKVGGREFCGYEVQDRNVRKRIVVFAANGKYYESTAYPTTTPPTDREIDQLFSVQQTVLSSIVFR